MELIEQYKQALKYLGKSITLISSNDGQHRYVTPSSAVTNFSYDPPSFLLPLEKSASLYPALAGGAAFTINVLGAEHRELVEACLRLKGEARFSVGNWIDSQEGPPVLADAQASFVCQCEQVSEYYSHALVIGRVVQVSYAGKVDPLIYIDGKLTAL
ncbi:MAG: flavin reductase (DIM6/NTAB) family NADH-FMN oxidoreductase RutF [Cellvibrionaceae bacterium]|jgi:flavin reductase (DIM6/NTAB) family NADH-FMN oxidoreductase RutF